MIRLFFQVGLCGRFCPIQENGIDPGRVASRNGLFQQIEEVVQLLFEISPNFHAACQFLPDLCDPDRANFAEYFLNGSWSSFPGHSYINWWSSKALWVWIRFCLLGTHIETILSGLPTLLDDPGAQRIAHRLQTFC